MEVLELAVGVHSVIGGVVHIHLYLELDFRIHPLEGKIPVVGPRASVVPLDDILAADYLHRRFDAGHREVAVALEGRLLHVGREGLEGGFGADEVETLRGDVDHVAVDVDDCVDLADGLRRLDAEPAVGPFALVGRVKGVCAVFVAAVGGVGPPPAVELAGEYVCFGSEVSLVEEVGVEALGAVFGEDEKEQVLDTGFTDDSGVALCHDLDGAVVCGPKRNCDPCVLSDGGLERLALADAAGEGEEGQYGDMSESNHLTRILFLLH